MRMSKDYQKIFSTIKDSKTEPQRRVAWGSCPEKMSPQNKVHQGYIREHKDCRKQRLHS